MAAALTPARLRVLTSAAEGHIKRLRFGGDSHIVPYSTSCRCDLRPNQIVTQQAAWLESNGLICPDESTLAYGWTWRPTSAGLAALGRNPT